MSISLIDMSGGLGKVEKHNQLSNLPKGQILKNFGFLLMCGNQLKVINIYI